MKPTINSTRFGSITVEGQKFERDIVIQLSGEVRKRKSKLSKAIYGTSHIISLDEAKDLYQKGADLLIIGTGQAGMVKLSQEAADYFESEECQVQMSPTPEAMLIWNEAQGKTIALFHLTC